MFILWNFEVLFLLFRPKTLNVQTEMDELIQAYVSDVVEEAIIAASSSRRRASWRVDPFLETDQIFQKNVRLSKSLVQTVMSMVEPLVTTNDIDLKTKVLCTLNFLATGSYQTPTGNNYFINLSQPSVSRSMEEVINALNEPIIFNRWVHFPENFQEMNRIARDFYQLYRFPGIIGCIDCTHVGLVPPNAQEYDERAYVNRKNYHSINTQLICDANLKIINVNARFPGSSHDSYIWNSSNVLNILENLHRAGHRQYHLIGDSGYALRPWMLTPLPDPEEGSPAFYYNEALKQARCTIERCNGVLKGRFRCLLKDRILHYKPPKVCKIVNACTVLHNMCVDYNIPNVDISGLSNENLGYTNDNNFIEMPHQINNMLTLGRQKQARIINNYFN